MLKKIESRTVAGIEIIALEYVMETPRGEVHGSFFTGYVQVASQKLCRISTYVVASYRPHLFPLLGKTDHKKVISFLPSKQSRLHRKTSKRNDHNEKTEVSLKKTLKRKK